MNFCLHLWIYYGMNFIITNSAELTAVNLSTHARELYFDVQNRDDPHHADPANMSAEMRNYICGYLTRSGIFNTLGLYPVDVGEISERWSYPGYVTIFFSLFGTTHPDQAFFQYLNPYRNLIFGMDDGSDVHELVFACPLKDIKNKKMTLYYVSKEYNINLLDETYKPGRFIFAKFYPYVGVPNAMMLAEEPAQAYTQTDFHVELHYLQMRKHIQMAELYDKDPLCRILSTEDDANNQHQRICAAISESAYFKEKQYAYPRRIHHSCSVREVTFRTKEGQEAAGGKLYRERMTMCYHAHENDDDRNGRFLFISRAYQSNQVFVYIPDRLHRNIYLENLSINIAIEDELNSFDFVED